MNRTHKIIIACSLLWLLSLLALCTHNTATAQRLDLIHQEFPSMPTDLMVSELNPWELDEPHEESRALVIISAARGWVEDIVIDGTQLALVEDEWSLSTEQVKNLRALALGCVRPSTIAWVHNFSLGINMPITELAHLTRVTLNANCHEILGDVNADAVNAAQETGVHEQESF